MRELGTGLTTHRCITIVATTARSPLRRTAILTDLQRTTSNRGAAHLGQNAGRQRAGQLYHRESVTDVDTANARAFDAALIGQSTNQLARLHAIFVSYRNTVAGHTLAGTPLAPWCPALTRRPLATFPARRLQTTDRGFVGTCQGCKGTSQLKRIVAFSDQTLDQRTLLVGTALKASDNALMENFVAVSTNGALVGQCHFAHALASSLLDPAHLAAFTVTHESDRDTGAPGTASPANTVGVGFTVLG